MPNQRLDRMRASYPPGGPAWRAGDVPTVTPRPEVTDGAERVLVLRPRDVAALRQEAERPR